MQGKRIVRLAKEGMGYGYKYKENSGK